MYKNKFFEEEKWDVSPSTLQAFKDAFERSIKKQKASNSIRVEATLPYTTAAEMDRLAAEFTKINKYFLSHQNIKQHVEGGGIKHLSGKIQFIFNCSKDGIELINKELQKPQFNPDKGEPTSGPSMCSIS